MIVNSDCYCCGIKVSICCSTTNCVWFLLYTIIKLLNCFLDIAQDVKLQDLIKTEIVTEKDVKSCFGFDVSTTRILNICYEFRQHKILKVI